MKKTMFVGNLRIELTSAARSNTSQSSPRAARGDGGGEAGRPRPDDDDVPHAIRIALLMFHGPRPPIVACGSAWRPTNPPGVRAVPRRRLLAR